jgi:hypothetical protein
MKLKGSEYVLMGILIAMGYVLISLAINSYNILKNLQQPIELTRDNLDFMIFAVEVQTLISFVFAVLFSVQFGYHELPAQWKEKIKNIARLHT